MHIISDSQKKFPKFKEARCDLSPVRFDNTIVKATNGVCNILVRGGPFEMRHDVESCQQGPSETVESCGAHSHVPG